MKNLSCKSCISEKGDGCGLRLRTDLLNRRQQCILRLWEDIFFKKKSSDEKKKLPSNKFLYGYQKCIKKKDKLSITMRKLKTEAIGLKKGVCKMYT